MDIKAIPVMNAGLSNRSINALQREGILTVGDMMNLTEQSLSEIRNLGKKSVEEILSRIQYYQKIGQTDQLQDFSSGIKKVNNIDELVSTDFGKDAVLAWLKEKDVRISALETLSVHTYNLLLINGYKYLHQIIFSDKAECMQIPRMDEISADEIIRGCHDYLKQNEEEILQVCQTDNGMSAMELSFYDMIRMPEYRDAVMDYIRENDCSIEEMGLTARALHCLEAAEMKHLSDIVFLSRTDLLNMPAMGAGSADNITSRINAYLDQHKERIQAVCNGDRTALLSDDSIREKILNLYHDEGFRGFSFNNFVDRLKLPESVTKDRLKKIIGSLLAENELEYVDYRCYRVYDRFSDVLRACTLIDDRNKMIILKRLEGNTQEAVSGEFGISKQAVSQIIRRSVKKVYDWYTAESGKKWFDEDYYRYFYSTYTFDKKDGIRWLGLNQGIYNYLDAMDVKRGNRDLQSALEDHKNLNVSLRLKIKNYLNDGKVYIDGAWIPMNRTNLIEVVVRKFCRENVSYSDFIKIYNDFLEQQEIAYDDKLYLTESSAASGKNHLSEAKFLLWKQNEVLRYYDIESRDYTELLEALNLESYENTELSTLKFMDMYPDIMKKYDIRDQYELHNLLRKTIPEGSYHDLHFSKMPTICFGKCDRLETMIQLIKDNSPVTRDDLYALVRDLYGMEPGAIPTTALSPYLHNSVYSVDQKPMSQEHREILQKALIDDFYYISEIRDLYEKLIPDADIEEINPYNLKAMGLSVLSNYVIQNHKSLDEYFTSLLTKEDITDITEYRERFVYVTSFSNKLMELRKDLQIIEFEPNQYIHFRKLEKAGVSREMIREFCEAVYDFVEENSYFSIRSIRQDGFESDLFDLGFSDRFYASLLLSDSRFSFAVFYGTVILYHGSRDISIQSFEADIIRQHGSIDVYDLMTELIDRFGCVVSDRSKIIYKVQGTEIYYDSILDRLYADINIYYRELDETEEL